LFSWLCTILVGPKILAHNLKMLIVGIGYNKGVKRIKRMWHWRPLPYLPKSIESKIVGLEIIIILIIWPCGISSSWDKLPRRVV